VNVRSDSCGWVNQYWRLSMIEHAPSIDFSAGNRITNGDNIDGVEGVDQVRRPQPAC